jgi:hypothetical protein
LPPSMIENGVVKGRLPANYATLPGKSVG